MTLSVIQAASNADTTTLTQPTTNWGSAPTSGNLMLAFGYIRNQFNPSPTNGWALATSFKATANWNLALYYKYAGASESASQTFDSNSGFQEWGFQLWEISGVSGNIWTDVIKVTFGAQNAGGSSSLANGSITTNTATSLVLSGYAGQMVANTTTISWAGATGWTFDSTVVETVGDAFSVFNFASGGHMAVTGGGAISSTITTSANTDPWTGGYIELGAGPAVGIGGATDANQIGSNSAITSIAGSLALSYTDSVIFAIVSLESFQASSPPTPSVTSVTASGLTFSKRFQVNPSGDATQGIDFEVWWAPAAATFSDTITVNITGLSGTNNAAGLILFAVGGANNYLSPWDAEPSMPYSSTTSISGWSTFDNPDFIVAAGGYFFTGAAHDPIISGGPTWSAINVGAGVEQGSATAVVSAYGVYASSAETSQTTSIDAGSVIYLDAITAGGTKTETGTVSMALGGVGFAAAEDDRQVGASLALHGIALSAGGGREESGVATVALSKASFIAHAGREETGTGTLALQGVAITVSAVDINALNPVRQFSTFG